MRFATIVRLFAGILLTAAACDAAAPSIESISPGVGQCGSDFPLRLIGAGLADAVEVMFYSQGLSCTDLKAVSANELVIQVRAAEDCSLGSYPFRLRTPQGISELRIVRITRFPVVSEIEPNNAFTTAQHVDLNVTAAGVLEEGDIDSFQVTLKRGQRLAAEVEAIRLGGAMLDTLLTIIGPNGEKILSVDDTALFKQDPFTTIVAPVDGEYVVQVRSTNFEGDANSRYALHLGSFPRPSSVYPAGGHAGELTTVHFRGDAKGDFTRQIQLPDSPGESWELFAIEDNLAAPTSNPFRVSPFPNVFEKEPNDEPQNLSDLDAQLPVAFNGIIDRPRDRDGFRFRLEEGKCFQFEAFATRIGSPLDTVLSIVDKDGQALMSNDDDGTHDSRLVFTAPYTGAFVLCVTDKRGEGGDQYVYRVEATEPHTSLMAFLPRPNRLSQERQSITVPRGNRVMAFLAVQRAGFDGPVQLQATGLPASVSFTEPTIPADRFGIPVVFEALEEAPLAGRLVEIRATSESGGTPITGGFRQIIDLVGGSADTLYQSVAVGKLAVAVIEPSGFSLSLDQPKTSLAQDGTMILRIHVQRAEGFDAPIDVSAPALPAWVDGPEKITVPATESAGILVLRAFPQAEPRTWPLCVQGAPGKPTQSAESGAGPARRRGAARSSSALTTPVSSRLVELRVDSSPVTGSIGSIAAEQGKEVIVTCQLRCIGRLPSKMTATLEGLPNRVTASAVAVSNNDSAVKFTVTLERNAPVGSFEDLVCRLTGTIDGDEVSYAVGRGGNLRIEAAGNLVIDDSGRPLSPLEALRRSKKQLKNDRANP